MAGGGDVARKGGPGIERADLLLINKTDLAPHVGVDVSRMATDARSVRSGLPTLALSRTDPAAIDELRTWVRQLVSEHRGGERTATDLGPMAPHAHQHG